MADSGFAAFSQSTRTSALGLRRERYQLSRLDPADSEQEPGSVELRVVQYGVTRERLAEIADDSDGWDGAPPVRYAPLVRSCWKGWTARPICACAADLVALLRPAKRRGEARSGVVLRVRGGRYGLDIPPARSHRPGGGIGGTS